MTLGPALLTVISSKGMKGGGADISHSSMSPHSRKVKGQLSHSYILGIDSPVSPSHQDQLFCAAQSRYKDYSPSTAVGERQEQCPCSHDPNGQVSHLLPAGGEWQGGRRVSLACPHQLSHACILRTASPLTLVKFKDLISQVLQLAMCEVSFLHSPQIPTCPQWQPRAGIYA